MYADMHCLPFSYRVKTTPVPENLFQCQINSDNLLIVPDYYDVNWWQTQFLNGCLWYCEF